jgi:hypothetical protein
MDIVYKLTERGAVKCKNCDSFQSYKSFYEDEQEPDDSGVCTRELDNHVCAEDECHFNNGVFIE